MIVFATHTGMTVEVFQAIVKNGIAQAKHPAGSGSTAGGILQLNWFTPLESLLLSNGKAHTGH